MGDKSDDHKVKLLYYLIGEKGRELCETLGVGSSANYLFVDDVITTLDGFCDPKKNETIEIQFFHTYSEPR